MPRRRLTERFPWLLPLRRRQRIFCFYLKMRLSRTRWARRQERQRLPVLLFESRCPMYNRDTGFPMLYQENKVHNLCLAARKLDGLMIYPGETFSFSLSVRHADRETPYRDALTELNGALTAEYGGGLCQISNLLCWLFLHTPLTMTERHGHSKKDFPEPPSDAPLGVDATVAEGWLDLRARNDTDIPMQLGIDFDDEHIIGRIYAGRSPGYTVRVVNRGLEYRREPDRIYELVDVVQQRLDPDGRVTDERTAYRNRCLINYRLPEGPLIN